MRSESTREAMPYPASAAGPCVPTAPVTPTTVRLATRVPSAEIRPTPRMFRKCLDANAALCNRSAPRPPRR